jgi:hypothetical protein
VVVTTTRIIEVHPFYGWGWADSAEEKEWDFIPAPFHAELTPGSEVWFGKTARTLKGIVTEPSHEMDGYSLLLSERHDPWDGDVNITMTSPAGRELSGFGSIDLASFDA